MRTNVVQNIIHHQIKSERGPDKYKLQDNGVQSRVPARRNLACVRIVTHGPCAKVLKCLINSREIEIYTLLLFERKVGDTYKISSDLRLLSASWKLFGLIPDPDYMNLF
ncbi:hypothetical protein ACJJTC_007500 [Scirpophaga incertulas]